MKVLLVFLVLELTTVAVVDCIRCYNCTLTCNDKFEESSTVSKVDCPSGQCMKSKAKAGDVHAVVRGCSPFKIDNDCIESEIFGIEAEVCTCDTDLCNGSPTFCTSLKFLLLLAAAVFIVMPLIL